MAMNQALPTAEPTDTAALADSRHAPVLPVGPARAGDAPSLEALAVAAGVFRSLGEPARLTILCHLMLGEHKVVELTEHLGLAQSTVSAHLRCLLDCGMVTVTPVGRASVYSLAAQPELLAVLSAAERLLAATGDAVALCPRYGTAAAR
jgi:DNA-binding transcriptional ArsR family regulator